ncbi:MAG: hypothetical protein HUU38_03895 [Anaerolineales bacterium]|nr:hypothetical protein [Anaerolineales bacterium]
MKISQIKTKYPKEEVKLLPIDDASKEYLTKVGLHWAYKFVFIKEKVGDSYITDNYAGLQYYGGPDSVGVDLPGYRDVGFGSILDWEDDGTLWVILGEWQGWQDRYKNIPEEYHSYLVLGDADDPSLIVVNHDRQVVLLNFLRLNLTGNLEQVFMNSSVLQMGQSFEKFEEMEEQLEQAIGDWKHNSLKVSESIIKNFEKELKKIAPPALTPGTFWRKQIVRLEETLKLKEGIYVLEQMEKYRSRLFARLTENRGRYIPLERIFIDGESTVLRAISEFILKAAEGMDEPGPNQSDLLEQPRD